MTNRKKSVQQMLPDVRRVGVTKLGQTILQTPDGYLLLPTRVGIVINRLPTGQRVLIYYRNVKVLKTITVYGSGDLYTALQTMARFIVNRGDRLYRAFPVDRLNKVNEIDGVTIPRGVRVHKQGTGYIVHRRVLNFNTGEAASRYIGITHDIAELRKWVTKQSKFYETNREAFLLSTSITIDQACQIYTTLPQ